MPIHLGHPNNKGLTVSPALKSLGIDLLRAAPSDIRIISNPRVVQDGYSSYISNIAAFMSAYAKQQTVPTNQVGYPVSLPVHECVPLQLPHLVISYNGQIPSKAIESLNNIGFERIKANKKDDLLIFRNYSIEEARAISQTNPIKVSPAPGGAVNLNAFDSYIIVLKVISNFLRAHTYPAFMDEEHFADFESRMEPYTVEKRGAKEHEDAPPTKKTTLTTATWPMDVDMSTDEVLPPPPTPKKEIKLRRAKPPNANNLPWGTPAQIPNTSGLFFPYVPELASWDNQTTPNLIEDYFLKTLSKTPEQQVERADSIRSAWGIVSKTESGNVLAHLCKIISLAIRSQCRVFPLISEGVYHGAILSGARYYIGNYGKVVYPITYAKLQEETGSYQFHTKVLDAIMDIVGDEGTTIERPKTMRELRDILLDATLSEEERDEVRKLSVHLNFKEKFLGLNAQTIIKLLDELNNLADQNAELPLHPSALFSRDAVYVALSAFGYQAPSPMIDSCPKIKIKGSTPPNTFVFRQKTLDIATIDWKKVLETKEITNNPRNLSRQNRDRSIVGNDKATVWGKMVETMSAGGIAQDEITTATDAVEEDEDDIVGAW